MKEYFLVIFLWLCVTVVSLKLIDAGHWATGALLEGLILVMTTVKVR